MHILIVTEKYVVTSKKKKSKSQSMTIIIKIIYCDDDDVSEYLNEMRPRKIPITSISYFAPTMVTLIKFIITIV